MDDPEAWSREHGGAKCRKTYEDDYKAAAGFLADLTDWLPNDLVCRLSLGWAKPEGLQGFHPYIDFNATGMKKLFIVEMLERYIRKVEVEAIDEYDAMEKAQLAAENGDGALDFHSDTGKENWAVFDTSKRFYVQEGNW